ncbi:MAG TPA: ABC transporter permease subunit [Candidatus Limnocylindrales bacterium]|nr:ABC transporter permease subunit [Candidatus Limnocylindrales bacterium]
MRQPRVGIHGLVSLAVGVAVWEVVGRAAGADWLPPASAVLARLIDLWATGDLQPALATSLMNLALGYLISVVLGLVIGTLMGVSSNALRAFGPYVDAGLLTPVIILAPVFLVLLGISQGTLVAIIVVFATFVIASTTRTAVATTDPLLREMARSLGATPREVLAEVTLRDAAPLIFSGLQLGMSRAVKGMIVGEVIITIGGLGELETAFATRFDAAGNWAITVVVLAVALIATRFVGLLDRLVNAWPR